MNCKSIFESSNLDVLFESKLIKFEKFIREKYKIEEEERLTIDEKKLTDIIKKYVKNESQYQMVLKAINEFEVSAAMKRKFWNKQYYKYGFVDANNTKREIEDFKRTKIFMNKSEDCRKISEKMDDEEYVENLSNFIESKFNSLNEIKNFKEKDKKLNEIRENFENSLTDEQSEIFDEIMRLTYQVEDYYFSLAYLLGHKAD